MKEIILKAIEDYTNEPQDGKFFEIRSIPSPEVLADWIDQAIKENLV